MIPVGIESMNVFGGTAFLDVEKLAEYRNLDTARFENLLMKQKTVSLPYEDPVTFAVNAAKPLLDKLSEEDKNGIELLITCTESGIDFGKSISTYVHKHLGLSRNCRLFELKQACYSGTAGFQMAVNFVLSQCSTGAKALVITTDISRFLLVEGSDAVNMEWSFAEPSSGAGAVAILVSQKPHIFQLDAGASGYYGYEVMDTCRPVPDSEAGDSDLSLMSYLDCCEQSFQEYSRRVDDVDYQNTFQYLAFHTPFGGMVKGAHRNMMRKIYKYKMDVIENDFQQRVKPGMTYCRRVGNIMGGTVFLSLAGAIDTGEYNEPKRIGMFSYGSGCCSEFYSGVVSEDSKKRLKEFSIGEKLDHRYELSMEDYEKVLRVSDAVKFGVRNVNLDWGVIPNLLPEPGDEKRLYLKEINDFKRLYEWR